MFCARCAGSGEILGNGMVKINCINCLGSGQFSENPVDKSFNVVKIDRRSKAYKEAIHEIMKLHPDISVEKAAKMFEETYDKV